MAYKPVNFERFNKSIDDAKARANRGSGWKPKIGKPGAPVRNVFRIMPMHENMDNVIVHGRVHFSLGPNNDTASGCLAPWAEECPACTWIDVKARSLSDPEAVKELKSEKSAQDRYGLQMVDTAHPEMGVQQYWFGAGEAAQIGACFKDDEGNDRDITDPRTGRDVICLAEYHPTKQFKGKPVKQLTFKPKETPSPLMDMAWLDAIKDMTEFVSKPKREDIEKALKGIRRDGTTTAAKPQTQAQTPPAGTEKPGTPLAAPKAEAPKPEAPAAAPVTKRPVADDSDPYAAARAVLAGVTFVDIKDEQIADYAKKAPDCYAPTMLAAGRKLTPDIADPKDVGGCCKCRLLVPCLAAKLAAA